MGLIFSKMGLSCLPYKMGDIFKKGLPLKVGHLVFQKEHYNGLLLQQKQPINTFEVLTSIKVGICSICNYFVHLGNFS